MHKRCGNLSVIWFLKEICFLLARRNVIPRTQKDDVLFIHIFFHSPKKSCLNALIIQIAALIINHTNSF